MKKILIVCVLLLGSSLLIPLTSAEPMIMISGYVFDPAVLMPGDTGTLTLTLKNAELASTRTVIETSGGETTTHMETIGATINEVWIDPASSGSKQVRATLHYEDIGDLAPGASMDITFKIVADSSMPQGLYFLTARVDVSGYQDVIYPIPIEVRNTSLDLLATNMPSKISKSGVTELTLTVINQRDAVVDRVMVTPRPVDGIEFLQDRIYVGEVAAGASQDIIVSVRPLETGVKNLTFDVQYKNGDNQHTTSVSRLIEVIETLDVAPIITTFPSSIKKGSSGKISIEVYNAKTEPITGVIVTPICNGTVIPSQYFIGAMDADDVFSASFDIYADTVDYGTQTISFKVSFKQGDDYYETPLVSKTFVITSTDGTSYQAPTGSSQQSNGFGGTTQTSSLTICIVTLLVVIIIIVVIVLFVMRWRKRRKAK